MLFTFCLKKSAFLAGGEGRPPPWYGTYPLKSRPTVVYKTLKKYDATKYSMKETGAFGKKMDLKKENLLLPKLIIPLHEKTPVSLLHYWH